MSRLRRALPALIQLAGIAAAAAGIALIYAPAGVIAAGVGLFLVGLVLDLPPRRA